MHKQFVYFEKLYLMELDCTGPVKDIFVVVHLVKAVDFINLFVLKLSQHCAQKFCPVIEKISSSELDETLKNRSLVFTNVEIF